MQECKKTIIMRLLVCFAGILFPIMMSAQQITVTGTVTDPAGMTLIGASIVEKGTSNVTIADMEGKYSITVAENAVLEVSFMGYNTAEIPVNGRAIINVVLEEDSELLDEIVVIGYASIKKKDLTGAIASVDASDIKDSPVTNIGQAIQGRISGVQVIDSGKPGDNVTIKIRGLGSINNCDPLIVIDGIPTDLGLSSLNTADIERLDVLKDASATAIYGSRGANGVIMITTKRGKEGKGVLSVNAGVSFKNATNVPTLLNAAQYAALNNEMMENSGRNLNPEWADPTSLGVGTNWMDELLQTGIVQNYSLNYAGGNEKLKYYISGGFTDQTGIVSSVKYQRFTFQSNTDAQIFKWLKLSNNITFSTDTKSSGSYSISDALKALPVFDVKDENGEWTGPEGNSDWYGSTRNPIGPTQVNSSTTNGYNILANITAEIKFTDWFNFKSTFGYDAKFWFDESFTPKYDWKPTPTEQSSRYRNDNKSFTYLWDNYFNINKTFAGKHELGVMAGVSAQWNKYDYLSAQKNVFLFDNVNQMNNGQEMYDISGSMSEWALLSFMARANYAYDDRYLITATVRFDGSSRFGSENRWGIFPSASAAWRISKEPWFPTSDNVNDLKIRAGYGVTGSQASVGNYGYLATYETLVYPFGTDSKEQSALVSTTLANPYLHWEEVAQANIGIDAAFLKSRLSFSIDGYLKETSEMLVKAAIPITSGFEDTHTTYTNAGKVRNYGVELTLNSVNFDGEFRWETSVSGTFNRNSIVDLNSDVPYYVNQINNSYVTMLNAGYPINVFYGYVTDGIFQNEQEVQDHAYQAGAEPGDIRFKDLNNDGVINDDDRTVIGNPNPTWMFSMQNTMTYKGFEFSFYLQGVAGNKIFNANNIDLTGMYAAYNQTIEVLDRWTGEGTSNKVPRAVWGDPNQNTRVSDRYVEDGSYLRLKNITLGYNFPEKWLSKAKIQGARIYVTCENVATLTAYSGFDPEVDINGIDLNRYPISRTYSVGLNFNF